eukprot:gene5367-10727_t
MNMFARNSRPSSEQRYRDHKGNRTKSPVKKILARKENALNASIREAEFNQARTFIKERSHHVDKDIESLRNKLNISSDNLNFDIDSDIRNRTKQSTLMADKQLEILGSSMKSTLNNSLRSPTKKVSQGNSKEINMSALELLLRQMHKNVEDLQISPYNLSEMRFLKMSELIDILQLQLFIPVTAADEEMIYTYYYDDDSRGIDFRALLQDAGLLNEANDTNISKSTRSNRNNTNDFDYKQSPTRRRNNNNNNNSNNDNNDVNMSSATTINNQNRNQVNTTSYSSPSRQRGVPSALSLSIDDSDSDLAMDGYEYNYGNNNSNIRYDNGNYDDGNGFDDGVEEMGTPNRRRKTTTSTTTTTPTNKNRYLPSNKYNGDIGDDNGDGDDGKGADLVTSDTATAETLGFLGQLLDRVSTNRVNLDELHREAMAESESESESGAGAGAGAVADLKKKEVTDVDMDMGSILPSVAMPPDSDNKDNKDNVHDNDKEQEIIPTTPTKDKTGEVSNRHGQGQKPAAVAVNDDNNNENGSLSHSHSRPKYTWSPTKSKSLSFLEDIYRDSWDESERRRNFDLLESNRIRNSNSISSPSRMKSSTSWEAFLEGSSSSRRSLSASRSPYKSQYKKEFDGFDIDDAIVNDIYNKLPTPERDPDSRFRTSQASRLSIDAWARQRSPSRAQTMSRRQGELHPNDYIGSGSKRQLTIGQSGFFATSAASTGNSLDLGTGFRAGATGNDNDVRWRNISGSGSAAAVASYSADILQSAIEDGVSDLSERRLLFELANHPSPGPAAADLVHRIVEYAGQSGKGYITCPLLAEAIAGVGLSMTKKEIELLASGFASNGTGGVEAVEVCRAIQALVHKLKNIHHGITLRKSHMGAMPDKDIDKEVEEIILRICEAILSQDRWIRISLAGEEILIRELAEPFLEIDSKESGILRPEYFIDALYSSLGYKLSREEMYTILQRYNAPKAPSEVMSWSQMTDLTTRGIKNRNEIDSIDEHTNIEYSPFIRRLGYILMKIILNEESRIQSQKHGIIRWALDELKLMETLLIQLENMPSAMRRKHLMQLQHALVSEDISHCGDLDGITVLKCLVNAGFKLQRLDRVRLLRSIEDMGGKIDYVGLCQLLLRTCSGWSLEERNVIAKILKAMGTIVAGRREWLAKLRADLVKAEAVRVLGDNHVYHSESGRYVDTVGRGGLDWGSDTSRSSGAIGPFSSSLRTTNLLQGNNNNSTNSKRSMLSKSGTLNSSLQFIGEPGGVSPSSFLTCLRRVGVTLSVEEEAVLLDCLDAEWRAAEGHLMTKEDYAIPVIHYKTFLRVLSRHVGTWDAAYPHLAQRLREVVTLPIAMTSTIGIGEFNEEEYTHNSMSSFIALHELGISFRSFDENGTGYITQRSFQVCCHKSILTNRLDEEDIISISEALVLSPYESSSATSSSTNSNRHSDIKEKCAGLIHYPSFLAHLRSLFVYFPNNNNNEYENDFNPISTGKNSLLSDIWQQLLKNVTDVKDGTISNLRAWILSNTDRENSILTPKDIMSLFRDFEVIYRPEHIQLLLMEIGFDNISPQITSSNTFNIRNNTQEYNDNNNDLNYINTSNWREYIIDGKVLVSKLLHMRRHWVFRYPQLAARIREHLDSAAASAGIEGGAAELANRIGARLAIFADFNTSRQHQQQVSIYSPPGPEQQHYHYYPDMTDDRYLLQLVDRRTVLTVCRSYGIPLDGSDVTLLADACDPNPAADHLNPKDLPCNTSVHSCGTRRNVLQWINDVKTVFAGLDRGGGVVTRSDFSLALELLNAPMSP